MRNHVPAPSFPGTAITTRPYSIMSLIKYGERIELTICTPNPNEVRLLPLLPSSLVLLAGLFIGVVFDSRNIWTVSVSEQTARNSPDVEKVSEWIFACMLPLRNVNNLSSIVRGIVQNTSIWDTEYSQDCALVRGCSQHPSIIRKSQFAYSRLMCFDNINSSQRFC
jgi:hypothetical protein